MSEENLEKNKIENEEKEVVKESNTIKQELEETTDRLKRIMAEFENFKKRSNKEREALYNSLLADIIASFLPVIDNLEKAVQAKTEDEGYKQGIELVLKQFVDVLTKFGVEEIKTVGETFDPEVHEAVSSIQDETKGENMESDIIKISHLNKSFGEVKAVNDLSFRVKKGELFAFLGVNGAGKSTTISILCGLLKKDSGTVQVNGIETDKAGAQTKRMLGVVFQDSVLDKPLTVKENLKSRAALYGITGNAFDKRLQELVEILDFDEFLNRPVGKLSGGQRRRIDIARALLHRPEILILDEPTTGLDPQTRQLIWNVIEKLQKTENMTVFLTTHYMEEAANAGYVVILDKGSVAAEGTPFELKNDYVQDIVSVYGISEDEIKSLNREYKKIRDGYQIKVRNTKEATELIVEHQDLFTDYEVVKGGMDDVFLAVTGKKLGGER